MGRRREEITDLAEQKLNKNPKKGINFQHKFTFDVSEDLFNRFNKYCDDNCMFRSKLMRKIVKEFLAKRVVKK